MKSVGSWVVAWRRVVVRFDLNYNLRLGEDYS